LTDRLFERAKWALGVKNAKLVDSAVVYTVHGEIHEEEDDDELTGDLPDGEEYVRVLASFADDHGGRDEIHIVEPLDPVVVVFTALPIDGKGGMRRGCLVDRGHIKALMPAFEAYVARRRIDT